MHSNRTFKKAPAEVALLLGTKPHAELKEEFYVASPPVRGPQACVIKMINRDNIYYLRDAVIVLPDTVPHSKLIAPSQDIRIALGISSTINQKYVSRWLKKDTLMSEIPATINNKPFRSDSEIQAVCIIKDVIHYLKTSNAKYALNSSRLTRATAKLERALEGLNEECWTPWILNKDTVLESNLHQMLYIVLNDWKKLKDKTWGERWDHVKKILKLESSEVNGREEAIRRFRMHCNRRGLG